ncbi:CrcB-like protein-domain-containing protein [Daldinia sp. FL1419]|nr:CrcB-like protein-domain-containing protein [Daldinia sp. FL1419]
MDEGQARLPSHSYVDRDGIFSHISRGVSGQTLLDRERLQAPAQTVVQGVMQGVVPGVQASCSSTMISQSNYDIPNSYANVPELEDIAPITSRDERHLPTAPSLEEGRTLEYEYSSCQDARQGKGEGSGNGIDPEKSNLDEDEVAVSRLATEIYTVSYLILFAILGTLARIGLQALTFYAGAPVALSSVWPNFAGSLILGFLAEDRMLFRFEWGTPTYELELLRARRDGTNETTSVPGSDRVAVDLAAAKKAHAAIKKTIPLYIGLATGFCGSFTSFSSFIRDVFLALSNDLLVPDAGSVTTPRNGGYSFMALVAVIITTISLSLSGFLIGAQLALALEPITPSFPFSLTRKFLDRFAVFLAWGCWIGAILLSVLPPDRFSNPGAAETWRGRAAFSLVFAPLGCLTRFYMSLYLNGHVPSFPLGTFSVNILGTAVLGMAWDLAHAPLGGVVGCQVLQGVEDGFCGCLTTVSTWVAELTALQRRHAYIYGATSVVVAMACMVGIMGGLRWTDGFSALACLH